MLEPFMSSTFFISIHGTHGAQKVRDDIKILRRLFVVFTIVLCVSSLS